jgi:tetraacyldisaccharide 4'-kinase
MKSSTILLPLSAVYGRITGARLAAYQRGWFSVSKLAAPVISVGNLTTGGTGKTPLVEWVCRAIAAELVETEGLTAGGKVCVLTRGYGRANPNSQVVVSDGTQVLADERTAGDEPLLLAQNLLGIAAVIANPDRVAAGEWAIENLQSEVFVLDDGFQHLRLARELDIVTIDATNPWGGGSLLPYGRLRETPAGLSRADCVVITRADQIEDLSSIKAAIEQQLGPSPIFSSRMVTTRVHRLDGENVEAKNFGSQPVAAFCGVGNPESFFKHLRREGWTPVFTRAFADHHNYSQSELDALVEDARGHGAAALVTTAKDAIKLSAFELKLPCFVVEVQISIDDDNRLRELIRAETNKSKVQGPKS